MIKIILAGLLIWSGQLAIAQDTLSMPAIDSSEVVLQRYLAEPGHEEEDILELIRLARTDITGGHIPECIHKIQIALILEKQLGRPSTAGFQLNILAGDIFRNIDQRYGIEFYKTASAIADQMSDMPRSDLFYLFTNRAGTHQDLHESGQALVWFRRAIEAAAEDNPTSVASSFNNIGVYYNEEGQYDSARYYFAKALVELETRAYNTSLNCAVRDNLAQLDIREGRYKEALATFRFNDRVYRQIRNTSSKYLANKIRLLEMMERLHLPGIADSLRIVESYIQSHPLIGKPKDVLTFYSRAENYFYGQADRSRHMYFRKKYFSLVDSLQQSTADQLHVMTKSLLTVQDASFRYEMRTRQLEAEKTKLELVSTRRMAFVGFSAMAIIGTLLILFFKKRRQQLEAQKLVAETALRNREMEARIIEQELELKKKDLTSVVLHNTQVHDVHQKMIGRLAVIHSKEEGVSQQIRTLLHELEAQSQISDRSLTLQQNIESINADFYEKLIHRFPGLTRAESELCGFIRISLSTKDISVLKNVEVASVKMGKNRLRKKLGLGPDDDLYGFVKLI